MAETGAALAIKPLPQPALEVEEPKEPEARSPRDGPWFEGAVPSPGRRSAWKDVFKTGMK